MEYFTSLTSEEQQAGYVSDEDVAEVWAAQERRPSKRSVRTKRGQREQSHSSLIGRNWILSGTILLAQPDLPSYQ